MAAHWCKLAVSKKGYLCLVQANSEPGDMVCLILGAEVPFILRRLDGGDSDVAEEGRCYTLVGERYIHSMMDGEIFNMSIR
jgi:hypothetical protein